jgi:hypothetical protein
MLGGDPLDGNWTVRMPFLSLEVGKIEQIPVFYLKYRRLQCYRFRAALLSPVGGPLFATIASGSVC